MRFRKLLSGSAIYTVGGLVNAIIPFLLLPILTRKLGVADYGLLATIQAFLGLLIPVISLGIPAALARRYYDEDLDYPSYFGANLWAMVMLSGLVTLLAGALAYVMPPEYAVGRWSAVVSMIAMSSVLSQIMLTQFQIRNAPKPFVGFTIGSTTFEVLLALLFVVVLTMGWEGRLLSQVIAGASLAGIGLWWAYKKDWLSFGGSIGGRYDMVKNAVIYGAPLIPHQLSLWAIALSDRIFVSHFHGDAEVGIYTVSSQLGMGVTIVVSAIATAWTPYSFESFKAGKTSEFTRAASIIVVLIGAACAAFALIGPWLQPILAGADFEASFALFLSLAIGQFFYAIYRFVSPVLFYTESTRMIASITVSTALVNLILNALLVPRWGSLGAAVATFISYGLSAAALVIFSAAELKNIRERVPQI